MKKIKIVNTNSKENNGYKKFVAKNVKLTPYDKTLIDYIYRTINKEIM